MPSLLMPCRFQYLIGEAEWKSGCSLFLILLRCVASAFFWTARTSTSAISWGASSPRWIGGKIFADRKNICCYHDGEQGHGHLLPPAPDEAVVSYQPPLRVPQSIQLVLQCDGRAAAALLILGQIFVPKCYLSGFMPSNQIYILWNVQHK